MKCRVLAYVLLFVCLKIANSTYYVRGGLNLHNRGLLGYYEARGFHVRHFAMTDYQRPSESQMQTVLEAFEVMPKPVLLHCSAAIDRTKPTAAYIVQHFCG